MQFNLDFIYPIGALFITTSTISPELSLGGKWTQITDDAYLKIVNNKAGELGGTSSEHKIPINSLPSHSHTGDTSSGNSGFVMNANKVQSGNLYVTTVSTGWGLITHSNTGKTGGGEAYYPYYYGVYVWKRVG